MVAGRALLAHDRDMMVRSVHGRAHQVAGAGVRADILLVDMLFMDRACHEMAIRCEHEAAELRVQRHIAHAGRDEDLLINLAHALADDGNVVFGLLWPVRDTHAAGEIDIGDMAAGLLLQLHRELEKDARQRGIVSVGERIGCQKCVDAELLRTLGLEHAERLSDLRARHAILGVAGVIHDLKTLARLAERERAARIEAAADPLRDIANGLFQKVHVRDIVQIDGRAELCRQTVILGRRLVGREHDMLAGAADAPGHHQLCERRAVAAAALLLQDFQNGGRGRGLHGEILPVAGIPRKSGFQAAGILADTLLVIEVKRCGIACGDVLELLHSYKRLFHWNSSL